jgi:hypothetical protein
MCLRVSSRPSSSFAMRGARPLCAPPKQPKNFFCAVLIPRPGQIESNYDETTDSFDNMNLKAELLRGVYAYGFERPSAIQQRAIMPVIKGKFLPPRIFTRGGRD